MPHTGKQINVRQALALCYNAGFRNQRLTTAVAIMSRESARFVGAYYINREDDGTPISADRGLFQVNSLHRQLPDEEAFCPLANVQYAFDLSNRGYDFTPWMAYTGGAYLEAMEYTETIRTTDPSWRDINIVKKAMGWCAPVPQDVLDLRAGQQ
jgi:hypothetical protein